MEKIKLAECDIVLVDGIPALENVRDVREICPTQRPPDRLQRALNLSLTLNVVLFLMLLLSYIGGR